jgi:hypothetical protein
MGDFEFLAGFYGLLLGLTVVEVATKFADAVDSHARRAIGLLTPLLAAFVLLDVTSFWMWIWSIRSVVTVGWFPVMASLLLAISYFLAAALVFPRTPESWSTLDDHYWARKRWVLGGITTANVAVLLSQMSRAVPRLDDIWFFVWQGSYFLPLAVLWISRRKAVDASMLIVLIAGYALAASESLPNSAWGDAVGVNGSPVSAQEAQP